ncbi:hypothetical protein MMC07_009113 [Pseudocyphellaria aurata]|nr:hypothetical protein [Pseudocyphellaria aurata]
MAPRQFPSEEAGSPAEVINTILSNEEAFALSVVAPDDRGKAFKALSELRELFFNTEDLQKFWKKEAHQKGVKVENLKALVED